MNDPLVEQINIIKGYVKQAREALRFEEVISHQILTKNSTCSLSFLFMLQVEILELNLRELQQEFYNRQKAREQQDQSITNEMMK